MQKSSDDLIRELEEKRIKYEERQAEHEQQQWWEERQFQLQMMQMMQMIMGHSPPAATTSPTPFYGSIQTFPVFHDENNWTINN